MTNNMTIGPTLSIGGNQVQMTQKGKIRVTNQQGKVKTLSQDEFKKQLIKNAENIEAGKDFEFKKSNTGLKALGVLAGTVALVYAGLGLAVGKGKLTKAVAQNGEKLNLLKKANNFFVKVGEHAVNLWKTVTKKATGLKNKFFKNKETNHPTLGQKFINEKHVDFAKNADTINFTQAERTAAKNDAKVAFRRRSFKPYGA